MKMFLIILFLIAPFSSLANNWELIDHFYRFEDDTSSHNWSLPYYAIDSYDELHCAAAGNFKGQEPLIRYTSNGGESWEAVKLDSIQYIYQDSVLIEINWPPNLIDMKYFSNELCVVVGDSASIWTSNNGCKTWKYKQYPNEKKFIHLYLYDETFGAVIGNSHPVYTLYFSYDGFNSIEEIDLSEVSGFDFLRNVFILDPLNIYIIAGKSLPEYGAENYIIYSSDGGLSWVAFDTIDGGYDGDVNGGRLSMVFFLTKNIGFGAGSRQKEPYSVIRYDKIYKTTDGGATWKVIMDTLTYPTIGLQRIEFTDDKNGYAFGEGSILWLTEDGGNTWFRDTSIQFVSYSIKTITSPKKGIMYGATQLGGKIFKYNDPEIGVKNKIVANNNYNLHPNPATSQITLSLGEEFISEPEIDIIDYLGNVIRWTPSGKWRTSDKSITINTSSLSPGVYFLRVRSGEKVEVRKFVVVR
jgi:photosystem II stability/assembly factor-like uncharacterized protein